MSDETFLDLARTWKYQGFKELDIHLVDHVKSYLTVEKFVETVERLLKADIREAEGYMTATLEYAEVKGVVRYSLGGNNGERKDTVGL